MLLIASQPSFKTELQIILYEHSGYKIERY